MATRVRPTTRGLAMLAGALCLAGLGAFGYANPWHLRIVALLLGHPMAYGVLALLLAGFGLRELTHRSWLKVLLLGSAAVAAGLWGLLGLFAYSFSAGPVVATARAGDVEVLVRETSLVIDPAWIVTVRQADPLLGRVWRVGCINGDDPAQTFEHLEWTADGRPRIVLADTDVVVRLDQTTGRPLDNTGPPWGC